MAEEQDPADKSIKAELTKARELLRSAVNRAPMVPVEVDFGAELDCATLEQGPELPLFAAR